MSLTLEQKELIIKKGGRQIDIVVSFVRGIHTTEADLMKAVYRQLVVESLLKIDVHMWHVEFKPTSEREEMGNVITLTWQGPLGDIERTSIIKLITEADKLLGSLTKQIHSTYSLAKRVSAAQNSLSK